MRWAACFFVVRAEYQGASSMRPGTTPPPALRGETDGANCSDKIRFAKSGWGWYNSYNCAAFCAGKVRS